MKMGDLNLVKVHRYVRAKFVKREAKITVVVLKSQNRNLQRKACILFYLLKNKAFRKFRGR